jgi:hypothetical protein
MNALGQIGARQRLLDTLVADVGHLTQSIEKTECLKDAGIDTDADSSEVKPRLATIAMGRRRAS